LIRTHHEYPFMMTFVTEKLIYEQKLLNTA
jgi:hypothetical protein